MNYRNLPLFLLLALLIAAPGCGDSSKKDEAKAQVAIEGSIPMQVGQTIQIKLPANPSGGYGWSYRTPLETSHLKEVKRSFQELTPDKITPEMTGYETWAFTALEKGNTVIELEYKQLHRADGVPAKTYFANVVIS